MYYYCLTSNFFFKSCFLNDIKKFWNVKNAKISAFNAKFFYGFSFNAKVIYEKSKRLNKKSIAQINKKKKYR